MQETALSMIRAFPGKAQLATFAGRLLNWLNQDLNAHGEGLTESRARALLLAAEALDEPTRHSFAQLTDTEPGTRIALYDLLRESGLGSKDEVAALAATTAAAAAEAPPSPAWLALAVAVHAWRSGFPLDRLDPAAPPDPYSPAGQVIKRAAFFARQQVQRSATERDKLGRKLAYAGGAATPGLDALRPDGSIAPLPPYFRPPVPVRYPEYTPGVQVAPEEVDAPTPATAPGAPLSISEADLTPPPAPPAPSSPVVQPPLRIDASQLEPPVRPTTQPPAPQRPERPANVIMPGPAARANVSGATSAVRRRRGRAPMTTTKLRIQVQEHPDGPGLYGLQVRVSSRGIRRFVAGTTNKDGEFICELPVQAETGLTYDVDVTWPRDFGGETERKSITLNADRTHFVLPFYRTLKA